MKGCRAIEVQLTLDNPTVVGLRGRRITENVGLQMVGLYFNEFDRIKLEKFKIVYNH